MKKLQISLLVITIFQQFSQKSQIQTTIEQKQQNIDSQYQKQNVYSDQEILQISQNFVKNKFAECQASNQIFQELENQNSIGEGSFGTVVSARLQNDNQNFAYKIISYNQNLEEELKNEIKINKIISQRDDIKAVKFYDCFVQFVPQFKNFAIILKLQILKNSLKPQFFYQSDGQNIFQFFTNDPSAYLQLDQKTIQRNFRNLFYSLHQIHQLKITLRDIKPENILANKDLHQLDLAHDQDIELFFIDFGLATYDKQEGNTAGTKPYIHPQNLLINSKKIDQKGDIYALCLTYFEIMNMNNEEDSTFFHSTNMHNTNDYQQLYSWEQQKKINQFIKKVQSIIKYNFLGQYSKDQQFDSKFQSIVSSQNKNNLIDDIVSICQFNFNCVIYSGIQSNLQHIPSAEIIYKALDKCIEHSNQRIIII